MIKKEGKEEKQVKNRKEGKLMGKGRKLIGK